MYRQQKKSTKILYVYEIHQYYINNIVCIYKYIENVYTYIYIAYTVSAYTYNFNHFDISNLLLYYFLQMVHVCDMWILKSSFKEVLMAKHGVF